MHENQSNRLPLLKFEIGEGGEGCTDRRRGALRERRTIHAQLPPGKPRCSREDGLDGRGRGKRGVGFGRHSKRSRTGIGYVTG